MDSFSVFIVFLFLIVIAIQVVSLGGRNRQ